MARACVSVSVPLLSLLLVLGASAVSAADPFTAFTVTSLVPVPAAQPGARYGASVASANGYVAVGAPGTAGGNGSVAIFDCRLSTCRAVQTLTPPDVPPLTDPVPTGELPAYGTAVAMANTLLLVGAPGWEVAYLYQCTVGATCAPLGAPLVKSAFMRRRALGMSGYEYDGFGETVAIGDGLAVVGASNSTEDGLGGPARGRAYTFACSTTTGCAGDSESALAPEAPFDDDLFGLAVAYSQGVAAVGAPGAGNNGTLLGNGAVTVWSCANGDCTAKTPYTIPGPTDVAPGSLFGSAVATHSGLVVVGSPGAGRAYVYACASVVGGPPVCTLQTTLVGAVADGYGQAVDVFLGTVAVGAPLAQNGDGATYVYDCANGANPCVLLDTVRGAANSSDGLGAAAAIISPTQVVVGSPQVATGGTGNAAYGLSDNSAPLDTRFPLYGIVLVVLLGGGGVLLVLFGIVALIRWRRSRNYETLGEDTQ